MVNLIKTMVNDRRYTNNHHHHHEQQQHQQNKTRRYIHFISFSCTLRSICIFIKIHLEIKLKLINVLLVATPFYLNKLNFRNEQ